MEEGACPYHFMGRTKEDLRGFSPSLVRDLRRLLDEENIDLVHCHRHKAALYGTLAVRSGSGKIPVVVTVHGLKRSRTLLRRLTNRYLLSRVTKVVAVSRAVREDVLRANPFPAPGKVEVIYNGIDISRYPLRSRRGGRRDGFLFGSVGRLTPTKGYDLLLAAFAALSIKDARLVIAGEGPMRERLEGEARRLGLAGRVTFAGFKEDVRSFLMDLDFFVLPSRAEGLSLALLEAMATGVPVIATETGGIPEVLHDPAVGCLVPEGSVDALRRAMAGVTAWTPERYGAMVAAARKRIEDAFSIESMTRKMEHLYQDILSPRRGKREGMVSSSS